VLRGKRTGLGDDAVSASRRKQDMAKGANWELVCSEVSRPFAIETFRLRVPNGWIYCTTITRTRMFARDEFSQSMVFVPDASAADSPPFP
jgi:hypothetical protein